MLKEVIEHANLILCAVEVLNVLILVDIEVVFVD